MIFYATSNCIAISDFKKKKKKKGSRVIFSVCLVLASKVSLFLLFSLFLVLFMGLIALFSTIHESHYTISDTF